MMISNMAQSLPNSPYQTATYAPDMPSATDAVLGSEVEATRWGWFPAIALLDACALLLVATAYTLQRNQSELGAFVFWISLLIIFAPIAYRLISPTISRRERIGLVVTLGIALYLVKVLHSPLDFTFYDEFLHWNTANHIIQTQRLFTENSILPVSALYPGLEIITTAFANLSGMSVVESGLIILGIGRVAFMLALYLFYERISSSPQIGGVAAILYCANSNFVFFDSQFSYESLSLPIAITLLFWVAYANRKPLRNFVQHTLLMIPLIGALTITHHLTSYVVVGMLGVWAVVAFFKNRKSGDWQHIGIIAIVTLAIVWGWSQAVGNTTSEYLGPVFRNGITEFSRLILDEQEGRELFRSATGQVAPIWERIVGIGAVALILLILPFGLFEIARSPFQKSFLGKRITRLRYGLLQSWQRYRNNALAYTLALIVLLHPVMQGFRLTSSGWEIANRSSEFLFWAIAFVITIGFLSLRSISFIKPVWKGAFVVWASIIFLGGTISGWPPWARLPGSYLVSADTRSIENQGVEASKWVEANIPHDSRVSADRINTLLLAVYGEQRPITHLSDSTYLASVFTAPVVGDTELELMRRVEVEYLLVDKRLSTSLPLVGVYFEGGEPNGNRYTVPMPLESLEKFANLANVSRVFDDGNISIYDVRALNVNP
ncbi:MAG: hypothetical protein LCI00_06985 [Chloroflexi bacterium]|nr:hypothetical protein [Chloroflexota bacterium]MCC6891662.1 hypothetical protein [Anaerolineae bacterium]